MQLLEVIAFTIDSCTIIETCGAARIELCANPSEGGTTPSYGMIKMAREQVAIELFPMIRPRGGDFLYNAEEYKIMKQDILVAKELHCDGVVLGLLQPNGQIDVVRTKRLVELAYPMEVSFHRAFDRVKDPGKALEEVISCGCTRLLTSGLQTTAWEGKEMLKKLVVQAGHRIIIMPGSGIRADNIEDLAVYCGATEFHTSARKMMRSSMKYNPSFPGEEMTHTTASADEISGILNGLKKLEG